MTTFMLNFYVEIELHRCWFRYRYNQQEPEKSTYYCAVCKEYHEYDTLPQHTPKLSNENGILKATFTENEKEISRHVFKQTHSILVKKMMKDYQIAQDMPPVIDYHEEPKLIVTNRVARSIYICVENGVSLINMQNFIQLQRTHGKYFKPF